MPRRPIRALLVALLAVAWASGSVAQSPSPEPAPSSAPAPWPTGDELRYELQQIGFVFRVDRDSGDWNGWAPRAGSGEAAALLLGGAGTTDATATFDFPLLDGDPDETDSALTAYMEVVARLPLDPADVERARRFVVEDLLVDPPEILEPCYTTDWERGALVATIDEETTTARLRLTSEEEAVDCAPLIPAEVAAKLGDPSTERLTIGMGGDPIAFDPSEVTLEGALVTLVLTFRNDSTAEQTLTFESPLESDTGLVAPGDVKLIVVRQLQPGEYPFHSETAPDDFRGVIRIEEPSAD